MIALSINFFGTTESFASNYYEIMTDKFFVVFFYNISHETTSLSNIFVNGGKLL